LRGKNKLLSIKAPNHIDITGKKNGSVLMFGTTYSLLHCSKYFCSSTKQRPMQTRYIELREHIQKVMM